MAVLDALNAPVRPPRDRDALRMLSRDDLLLAYRAVLGVRQELEVIDRYLRAKTEATGLATNEATALGPAIVRMNGTLLELRAFLVATERRGEAE